MKTAQDLEKMKSEPCIPFGTGYNTLMMTLEHYYISKLDGMNRIRRELEEWEPEAQHIIVKELINMLKERGGFFNENEIWDLI